MTRMAGVTALLLLFSLSLPAEPLDPVVAPDPEPAVVEAEPKSKATPELDRGAMIEGVDIPTSEVLDAGTYGVNFRFYNEGGLISRLLMSPFRRVHLGLSFDAQRVIGAGDPHMTRPSLYFKLRPFDGTDILPAIALGYENQGHFYSESQREYRQDGRGMYFVMSHEIFLPDFELHGGMNVPNFDDNNNVYGFAGFSFRITPSFAFLTEYDNIRNGPENRVNLGGRFWLTPYFNVDVGARNVGRGAEAGAERIVKLNYIGQFPF